jgi:hypothetical protein
MLIAYRHRFIFVHVYKTGGTSIKEALHPCLLLPQESFFAKGLQKLRLFPVPNLFHPHVKASVLRERLGRRIFDSFFKFAFVRNPWDREVSNYFYLLRNRDHELHEEVKNAGCFERYLEWRRATGSSTQKELIADPNGRILVDFVGRFENLEVDFEKVCARLGVRAKLPYLNRGDRRPYREYYSDRTQRFVAEYFREDIEHFGYHF